MICQNNSLSVLHGLGSIHSQLMGSVGSVFGTPHIRPRYRYHIVGGRKLPAQAGNNRGIHGMGMYYRIYILPGLILQQMHFPLRGTGALALHLVTLKI